MPKPKVVLKIFGVQEGRIYAWITNINGKRVEETMLDQTSWTKPTIGIQRGK